MAFVGAPAYFDIANFDTQVSTQWGRVPVNVAKAIADAFAGALHL